MGKPAYIFAVGAILLGCAEQASIHFLEEPSATQVSETTEYPGVVRIIGPRGRGLCTGTIVHPRAVLTASHCTLAPGGYRVVADWGSYLSSKVLALGPGTTNDPHDIALIVFDERIAEDDLVIPISVGAEVGEPVALVGFGCANLETQEGTNVKRLGRNRIYRRSEYLELATPLNPSERSLLGPENLTGTCFGDSGGPMLRKEQRGTSVTGVVHGGRWNQTVAYSLFSDLGDDENFAFLETTERQNGLYLTRPCEAPGNRMPYCQVQSAETGIVPFLKWIFSSLVTYLLGWLR